VRAREAVLVGACPTNETLPLSRARFLGKFGYHDHDEGDHAVVYFGEPIHSGHVPPSSATTSPT